MSHNHGDTIPLHPSSAQSDMDEIESLIHVAPSSAMVLPARPPSPPRASIPVSSSPAPGPVLSKPPLPAASIPISVSPVPPAIASSSVSVSVPIGAEGFGPSPSTLTEPVWDTVKQDLAQRLRSPVFHQRSLSELAPTPARPLVPVGPMLRAAVALQILPSVAAMAPHSLESGRHAEGPPVSDAWLWHHCPQGNHHSPVFGCPFFFMCEDFFLSQFL